MTTDIPTILNGLPIHWQGVDDSTPDGCTLIVTEVVGLPTTYVLRDNEVIGRVGADKTRQYGYVGAGLKGGQYIGRGVFYELAAKIAAA
jgi:hypothetical protein